MLRSPPLKKTRWCSRRLVELSQMLNTSGIHGDVPGCCPNTQMKKEKNKSVHSAHSSWQMLYTDGEHESVHGMVLRRCPNTKMKWPDSTYVSDNKTKTSRYIQANVARKMSGIRMGSGKKKVMLSSGWVHVDLFRRCFAVEDCCRKHGYGT